MSKKWTEDKERKRFKEKLNTLIPHGQSKIIAKQIGVTESTLSSWRKSYKTGIPTILDAVKLAKALNISLAELAGVNNQDEAFNHPAIQAIANISADLPQNKLRYMQRIANQLPTLTVEQIEKITEILELMSTQQQENTCLNKKYPQTTLKHLDPSDNMPLESSSEKLNKTTKNYVSTTSKHVQDNEAHEEIPKYNTGNYTKIPYYGSLVNGPSIKINESVITHYIPDEYIVDDPSNYYTLSVTDNSMKQVGIPEGCIILVQTKQGMALINEDIYVIRHKNKIKIKKIAIEISIWGTVEYWLVWCDGRNYKEKIVDNDWAILGKYIRVVS